MRAIDPRPMDAAAFRPFGELIDVAGRDYELINDASTQRYGEIAALDLCGGGGPPVVGIYVARARAFPLPIAAMERHHQAAQVFLPLGSQRFVVVVAPGSDAPEAEGVAAFVTAPGQGVVLRRGCWHHGLVALGDGDRFAVLEGASFRTDTALAELREPLMLAAPGAG